ncbi:hypothetical protein CK203_075439 [Vitis vinifera]|uniref:Retrovirus-related Pol polyprotein from transposon RE1 n=1 Tax=Vitis vinifera TaxID=29760 RepID=A0A438EUH2_VITVI|nr:hypothetical protein CK203_075439 [Vitis vinifera]
MAYPGHHLRQAFSWLHQTGQKPPQANHQGFDSVTSFLQSIKAKVDEFALFGAPLDAEDLTNKILDGLGEEYRDLTLVVQARDMPITFEELHEKLLNFEASAITPKPDPLQFPTTTNPTSRNPTPWPSPAPQAPTIIHGAPPTATKTGILLHKPATSPHLKDIHTGATLLKDNTKDGVYEWSVFPPLLAFSSIKTTLSEWH